LKICCICLSLQLCCFNVSLSASFTLELLHATYKLLAAKLHLHYKPEAENVES
jgi:hypothetical protein